MVSSTYIERFTGQGCMLACLVSAEGHTIAYALNLQAELTACNVLAPQLMLPYFRYAPWGQATTLPEVEI